MSGGKVMKKMFLFHVVFIVFIAFSNNTFAKLKVIYPNVNEAGEEFFGYAVLKLALENSGKEFELNVSKVSVNNDRIRVMIKQKKISISDFGTSPEYEQEFLPIYFPIDMGLNGWRIFLIHNDEKPQFTNIEKIEDLRKKIAGQGVGWSDVQILKKAGLKVQQASSITNLFRMIEGKRFDYFPLGVNEVHSLLEEYRTYSPNVIVEQKILLIYPFGRLFFVNKDNQELHDAVKAGLVKSFENGSFWRLFKTHKSNAAIFTKTYLKKRTQIFIDNSNITEEFEKIPKKYFFKLDML
jgi:hypothetical protein